MLERIKIRLGETADNFTDSEIILAYEDSKTEVLDYCNRTTLNVALENICEQIAVYKLNRKNTEGTVSEDYSDSSFEYLDTYPDNIVKVLNKNRLVLSYGN